MTRLNSLPDWPAALTEAEALEFTRVSAAQMKPEQQEIERLRRELARMKAERDILKKAAAYFARDSI